MLLSACLSCQLDGVRSDKGGGCEEEVEDCDMFVGDATDDGTLVSDNCDDEAKRSKCEGERSRPPGSRAANMDVAGRGDGGGGARNEVNGANANAAAEGTGEADKAKGAASDDSGRANVPPRLRAARGATCGLAACSWLPAAAGAWR